MTHTCHNPNCGQPIPAHLVSHRSAWFALPKRLRDAIWGNYRAGQEDDKRPTMTYLEALEACCAYWKEHGTQCQTTSKPVSREHIHRIARR
jgi:hypothetical protein